MGQLGEKSVPLGHQNCADIQSESVLGEEEISQLLERAGLPPSFNYIAVIKYSGKIELKGERVISAQFQVAIPHSKGVTAAGT